MKGLIFDIKRFAVHDGPGIRTTVFFKGCPLNCWWCHNPESRKKKSEQVSRMVVLDGREFQKHETVGRWVTVDEVMKAIDKESVFYNESGGGVTLSGGEPLMHPEFVFGLLKACRAKGYHTAIDTCGHVQPEIMKDIANVTDLFLYDLKHPDFEEHKKYTGVDNNLVLQNLKLLGKLKKQVIIRIPVIPGVNNSTEVTNRMIAIIKESGHFKKVHLLPFHNMAGNKYERFRIENKLREQDNLEPQNLEPMKKQIEAEGFEVRIGG